MNGNKTTSQLSNAFKGMERDDIQILKHIMNSPDCHKYQPDLNSTLDAQKFTGEKRPFGVNTSRFASVDLGIPGAGTYNLPDSCKIKDPKYLHASMRSTVTKGLD